MQPEPTSPPPFDLLPGRRTFFGWLTYATGATAAAIAGLPLVRYFVGTPRPEVKWVELGAVETFPLDETRMVTFENPLRQPWDGAAAHTGVFVRFEGQDAAKQPKFRILAVNCTHLGCPVSWFPQSGLFMCPCHGGVYDGAGERASGPPPRGLYHCVWRITAGRLEVQAPHFPSLGDPLDDATSGAAKTTACCKPAGSGEHA